MKWKSREKDLLASLLVFCRMMRRGKIRNKNHSEAAVMEREEKEDLHVL